MVKESHIKKKRKCCKIRATSVKTQNVKLLYSQRTKGGKED